jgi:hypothetical protein
MYLVLRAASVAYQTGVFGKLAKVEAVIVLVDSKFWLEFLLLKAQNRDHFLDKSHGLAVNLAVMRGLMMCSNIVAPPGRPL